MYSRLISSNESSPYCDANNMCNASVSCDFAFATLVHYQKEAITIPPIISLIPDSAKNHIFETQYSARMQMDRMYAGKSDENEYIESSRVREVMPFTTVKDEFLLSTIEKDMGTLADRMLSMFPKLVYIDELDGELLRSIVDSVTRLNHTDEGVRSYLYKSKKFRKVSWSIVMMMNHLKFNYLNMKLDEMETILISMVAYVHAFMHVQYMLKLLLPDLLLLFPEMITTLVKYHPRYTKGDGAWYIGTGASRLPRIGLPVFSVIPAEDLEMMWSDLGKSEILQNSTALMQGFRNQLAVLLMVRSLANRELDLILYTFKYFSDFHPDEFQKFVRGGVYEVLNTFSRLVQKRSEFVTLVEPIQFRLFRDLTAPVSSDNHIHVIAETNKIVPIRLQDHLTRIPTYSRHKMRFIFEGIARMSKFDLAGNIVVVYGRQQPNLFNDFLDWIFDRFFDPHLLRQPLRLKAGVSRVSARTIGRIIALAIRVGSSGHLAEYVISRQSVFETVFFSSNDVAGGFFDVFHTFPFSYGFSLKESLESWSSESPFVDAHILTSV